MRSLRQLFCSARAEAQAMRLKTMLLALLVVIVAGCATGPDYKDIGAEIEPVEAGKGRIYVYRPQLSFLYVGAVTLNSEPVRVPSAGGFVYVDKAPGDYKVEVDAVTDESTTFELEAGKEVYVRITVDPGGYFLYTITPQITDRETAIKEMQELNYMERPEVGG
jgi:hypothetical protein